MKIGYSFWGFMGAGIIDTPDGGRSHRATLIDGLMAAGHHVVFLQANRDLDEARDDLGDRYTWEQGLPDIDVLMCEWRWPIPGRNITACGTPGHTCDLHRQDELLAHYTRDRHLPTLLWDKDLQLPGDHRLRQADNVTVCEAALHPRAGAARLLFPVADAALDNADPVALAAASRDLSLVYIGNQYDRDAEFDRYFAPVAATVPHRIAGKWTSTQRWPELNFTGRIPFPDVQPLYRRSVATMLLAPDRLAACGQFTQRLPEAVLAGCLPLAPAYLRSADRVVPEQLITTDARTTRAALTALTRALNTTDHVDLITRCLAGLEPFRLSRQLTALTHLLEHVQEQARGRRHAHGPPTPRRRR
ncbi:hypothetical protein [Actinomadura verrucosospora]